MSTSLNEDQKVVQDGRKNSLKDVKVSLREASNKRLLNKLKDLEMGRKLVEVWHVGSAHRQEQLKRQETLLAEYDEFLEPIYDATQEWSSTLHLPIALTVAKTLHARMQAALLGVDPPFTMKARQAAGADRAPLLQEFMRYTLKDWCNHHQGIEEQVDNWIWNWVTRGTGILKIRWERVFSRYVDVKTRQVPGEPQIVTDPTTGEDAVVQAMEEEEFEEEVTIEAFDGPVIECVPDEDILLVGGGGDPQLADYTYHSVYMTASDLWQLADQGVFEAEAVEETIKAGESNMLSDANSSIKEAQARSTGVASYDKEFDLKRYHVLEVNAKIDVDGSGINTDVVAWVSKESRQLLRATYLRRVMPQGLRNLVKIDFHKRFGQDWGVGIIELIYSLTKEIDAIHNMKVDFGLISTMPFGFYRPTNSLSEERIPYEPGALIPLDNPQADVYFPNLGNRASFTAQEEQSLMLQIERFTAISDLSLGVIGGQGATRTATGTRALLGEANANLDVYLRRLNRGWKRVLMYLFCTLQLRVKPGMQFRIMGDDGSMYWETIRSREELQGMYDFELESNSVNSNPAVQKEVANQVYQLTANPLDIQLGIISPQERFEAMKLMLQTMGVRDWSRFIRKPQGFTRIFTPEEVAGRVLAGVDVRLGPEQDLQGFLDYVSYVMENDELLGQFSNEQTVLLAQKAQEAQGMLQALQQQAAQAANAQQVQMNTAMSQAPMSMPAPSQAPQMPGSEQ